MAWLELLEMLGGPGAACSQSLFLIPVADGTVLQGSVVGAATRWQAVADPVATPDDDTSYWATSTGGEKVRLKHDLAFDWSQVKEICRVRLVARMRETGAVGPPSGFEYHFAGGFGTWSGDTPSFNAAYATYVDTWLTTNPASGLPWVIGDFTNTTTDHLIEWSVGLFAGGSDIRVTQVYLEIEYTPPDCPPFEFETHGRQGIGVVQPQSGTDYPLVRPSEDIRYLIADLHLSYDDPGDYGDGTPYELPFSIKRLTGIGCALGSESASSSASASSEGSAQTHVADICIVDANGVVVFDSTDLSITHYDDRAWGSRLHIYEWRKDEDAACFMVVHTKWDPTDEDGPFNHDYQIVPESAIIDERAIMRLPKRVRSITVVLDRFKKTAVDFDSGYNMLMNVFDPVTVDGGRRTTLVQWDASPGGGLGLFPGCDPAPLVIRRINGVGPNDVGDFYLSALDCYYQRQPTEIVNADPRLSYPLIGQAPGNVLDVDLPDANAGSAKNLPGWPTDDLPAYAHLQIGSDCPPCCDCPDYVDVGNYLNRERNRYHALGVQFEDTRDQYHLNRERWLEALACFHRRPLRIFLQPQVCPYIDVVAQFCNQTDECVLDVELTVDLTSTGGAAGSIVPGFTFITGATRNDGRRSNQTERYTLGGAYPSFSANFESIEPGSTGYVKFRLEYEDCGLGSTSSAGGLGDAEAPPVAVTGSVSATVEGMPLLVSNATPPPDEVDAGATAEAVLECPHNTPPFEALKCVQCEDDE